MSKMIEATGNFAGFIINYSPRLVTRFPDNQTCKASAENKHRRLHN